LSDLSLQQIRALADSQAYWLPFAVFLASLAGSWHCVAMCGGLSVAACSRKKAALSWYHAGRLLGYLSLGSLGGFLGGSMLEGSRSAALPWITAALIGIGFIYQGLHAWRGGSAAASPLARWYSGTYLKLWSRLFKRSDASSSLQASCAGFLTAFLPCGWLYSFVMAAMVTQRATTGALVLLFFWLGTLPALSAAPLLFQRFFQPIAARLPRASAVLLIAIGLLTLGLKLSPLVVGSPKAEQEGASCPFHHAS